MIIHNTKKNVMAFRRQIQTQILKLRRVA